MVDNSNTPGNAGVQALDRNQMFDKSNVHHPMSSQAQYQMTPGNMVVHGPKGTPMLTQGGMMSKGPVQSSISPSASDSMNIQGSMSSAMAGSMSMPSTVTSSNMDTITNSNIGMGNMGGNTMSVGNMNVLAGSMNKTTGVMTSMNISNMGALGAMNDNIGNGPLPTMNRGLVASGLRGQPPQAIRQHMMSQGQIGSRGPVNYTPRLAVSALFKLSSFITIEPFFDIFMEG